MPISIIALLVRLDHRRGDRSSYRNPPYTGTRSDGQSKVENTKAIVGDRQPHKRDCPLEVNWRVEIQSGVKRLEHVRNKPWLCPAPGLTMFDMRPD
jgi:hypothetical protein